MKKLLALALALVLSLGVVSFAAAEEPFEITVMLPQFPTTNDFDPDNNPVLDKIEELSGVRLKITWAPNSEYETLFSSMLADKNPPMVVVAQDARAATVLASARKGAFWDLTDFIADAENYPYLAQGNAGIYNNISVDGRVYGIFRTRDFPRGGAYYRVDIAKEMGFDKEVQTIDDLTELAEKLNAYSADTYALNMCEYVEGTVQYITILFGAPNTWGIDEEGNVYPAHESPAYLEGLNWLRSLYANKGIDPNFITAPSGSWNDAERNDKAFMRFDCLDNAHRQQEWFEQNKGTTEIIWKAIGPVAKADGTISQWAQNPGFSGEVIINKKTDNRNGVTEEDLPKVVKFLDWCNGPEGQLLLNGGLEDLTYVVDEDGFRSNAGLEEANDKYVANLNQLNMGVPGDLAKPGVKQTELRLRYRELLAELTPYAVSNPCYPYDSETSNNYGNQLKTLLNDAAANYIAGNIDEAGLRAMWQQWSDEGGAKMTQEYNDAYHAAQQ